MKKSHYTSKKRWDEAVAKLLGTYQIYAPVETWDHLDYIRIDKSEIEDIRYNKPRPTTPLKTFLLPVKENVTNPLKGDKKIIIGVPHCDLKALEILDIMYLGERYRDPVYESNRRNTYIIGGDCHDTNEYCHCTSYGVNPYPNNEGDLSISVQGDDVLIYSTSEKGDQLLEEVKDLLHLMEIREDQKKKQEEQRAYVKSKLEISNKDLPDYQESGVLVKTAENVTWEEHSQNCVSCGACATSCPTCSCFLLIDRPGFEKVRNMDACQYPGFERVAAGENPLDQLSLRFKNRYMCKYVWKPEKFDALACTGCGRCIEGCIGNINKNELLVELSSAVKTQ